MYFDTHAHYHDHWFDEDRDALLDALPLSGVELVMECGTDVATSRIAAEMSRSRSFIYAAAGIHPEELGTMAEGDLELIRGLILSESKIRAVGEIGLDYHYEDMAPKARQMAMFDAQLSLAEELDKPAIVHIRDACADTLSVIALHPRARGVVHCFGESWETAKWLLDRGWYLSFTGSVTFKNARKAPQVATLMPIERLMLETDSPYLAPAPNRGKRNDSRNLRYICDFVAALRGLEPVELARITTDNGKRLFAIE